jgi:hypothetical protein
MVQHGLELIVYFRLGHSLLKRAEELFQQLVIADDQGGLISLDEYEFFLALPELDHDAANNFPDSFTPRIRDRDDVQFRPTC